MKNIILILTAVFFSATCFAAERLQVVATLPVFGDIAKKVGGEFVEVSSLAQPNQNPHRVEANPKLKKMAIKADVFIENGMSLELWSKNVVSGSANSKIQPGQPGHVVASKGVSALEVPASLTRALGDIHPGGNPHVWLDPLNAKIIARNISLGLVASDPVHKLDYERLLKEFETSIDTRMIQWMKKAEALKEKKVITYHKTFAYFANRFGISIEAEIEEKPGISPSARYRDSLVELVKKEKINTIIHELYYDTAAAKYIAEKTGAKVMLVPIDVGAVPEASDYFTLIDLLLNRLAGQE